MPSNIDQSNYFDISFVRAFLNSLSELIPDLGSGELRMTLAARSRADKSILTWL